MTHPSSNYRKYKTQNPIALFLINRFLDRIFKTLSSPETGRILEVGCGEGFVISHLRRQGLYASFEGLDQSEEALKMAKELNPEVPFSCGDIYSLPVADKAFDTVMALEVLEHLKEPMRALKELCRVSHRVVLLSVPNEPLFSLGNLARGKHLRRLGRDPEHLQFWERRDFIKRIGPFFTEVRDVSVFPWTICVGIGPR